MQGYWILHIGLITLWQTMQGEVNRRTEWKEKAVRKWGMVSMRAAGGTACSQTRLKSETCTTTEPGRGRGQRETHTSGRKRVKKRERENVHPGEKRAKYAGLRHGNHAGECTGTEKKMETWNKKCRRVNKICKNQVGVSLRERKCLCSRGERVMCLGRESSRENREGCEWACSVWTDIGCRLSLAFCVLHKHTQQQWHLPHSRGQREHHRNKSREKDKKVGVRDFIWDFPSHTSLLLSGNPESGALFSNQQRIILLGTAVHHTGFGFHLNQPFFSGCGNCFLTCSFGEWFSKSV